MATFKMYNPNPLKVGTVSKMYLKIAYLENVDRGNKSLEK